MILKYLCEKIKWEFHRYIQFFSDLFMHKYYKASQEGIEEFRHEIETIGAEDSNRYGIRLLKATDIYIRSHSRYEIRLAREDIIQAFTRGICAVDWIPGENTEIALHYAKDIYRNGDILSNEIYECCEHCTHFPMSKLSEQDQTISVDCDSDIW